VLLVGCGTRRAERRCAAARRFGNDINSRSLSQSVLVQACEAAEAFNPVDLVCTCAPGFGLVLEDATCRLCTADEVIPPGSLSCATCPALSAPTSPTSDTCECFAGYFGTIFGAWQCAPASRSTLARHAHCVAASRAGRREALTRARRRLAAPGATGACTQCPADTYRSATDAPEACLACPVTSNTFALGAQSATDCLCDVNTFNAANGVNATFSCAAVPEGGWAPRADSRLFALKDYWRPGPEVTEFFPCAAGNCNREQLPANGTLQQGYSCRNHHTGHLCSVCEDGTAYIVRAAALQPVCVRDSNAALIRRRASTASRATRWTASATGAQPRRARCSSLASSCSAS
jgi:hypothetical protein